MFLVCAPGSVAWQPGPGLALVARHHGVLDAMALQHDHGRKAFCFSSVIMKSVVRQWQVTLGFALM